LFAQTGSHGLFDVVVDLISLDIFITSDTVDDADEFLRIHKSALYLVVEIFLTPTKKAVRNRRPETTP
jgi:hypothetical protein